MKPEEPRSTMLHRVEEGRNEKIEQNVWRKNVRSPASGALSKYQFETATGIGMRHTFHRPLWSAFHFYLYLPPRGLPAPTSRDFISVVLGSVGTARKREGKPEYCWKQAGVKGVRKGGNHWPKLPTRYFTTFCFQSAVEGVGASPASGLMRLLWR